MSKKSPLFIEIGHGLSVMAGLPIIPNWKTRERPRKPKGGTFGFNSQTNSLEYWDGTNWLKAGMT